MSARQDRTALVELFPACFAPEGGVKKPLKIGIDREVAAHFKGTWSRKRVSAVMWEYVRGPNYQRALLSGEPRVGLDGQPCGEVDEDAIACARRRLHTMTALDRLRKQNAALVEALRALYDNPASYEAHMQAHAALKQAEES